VQKAHALIDHIQEAPRRIPSVEGFVGDLGSRDTRSIHLCEGQVLLRISAEQDNPCDGRMIASRQARRSRSEGIPVRTCACAVLATNS